MVSIAMEILNVFQMVDHLISSGQIDSITRVSYSDDTKSTNTLASIIYSGQVFVSSHLII